MLCYFSMARLVQEVGFFFSTSPVCCLGLANFSMPTVISSLCRTVLGMENPAKPSDGLRAHFPQYDYDDMVAAQYALVEKGLNVNHTCRLILGKSMGCMHSWVWGETYPDFMDALMPLACLPVEIAGRNRIFRKMVIDGILDDPDWQHGDYTAEPSCRYADIDRCFIARSECSSAMANSVPDT